MGKRGPKPKGKVTREWSAELAYAVGLFVADGNISPDGRHIAFVSKDAEQIENFMKALSIKVTVGITKSGYTESTAFRVQFSDVLFYGFLVSIGLMPNKSKQIGRVTIPNNYFWHYVRGAFDGDGSVHSYFDPRYKSSFMFYTIFSSASEAYVLWLQGEIFSRLNIRGHITGGVGKTFQLKYAKNDSIKVLKQMYSDPHVLCLSRKRLKIKEIFRIIGQRL